MKAKSSYSGIIVSTAANFTPCCSPNRPELLNLSGNGAKMRLINDLFNAGEEEEARKMFRQALDELTRKLERILDGENTGDVCDRLEPKIVASLLNQEI